MKKYLSLLLFALCIVLNGAAQNVIDIVYNGNEASVSIPENIKNVFSTITDANVEISSMTSTDEYVYRVSGESSDGSLVISGKYKLTLQLAGLTLTNAHGGAAIDIQCGKRIAVELEDGTINTLVDSSHGDQKAALYFKGHPEFKGGGTLNVKGNLKHAISAKEYIEFKKSTGVINILGAVSDGIHCGKGDNNYEHNFFEMKGGTINIANVGSDCIDADDYGTIRIYDGELSLNVGDESNGLKADSVLMVNGGNINIAVRGDDSEGIISRYKTFINGGDIDVLVTGKGSKGIESKRDDNTTTVKDGGYFEMADGVVSVYVAGSSLMKEGEKKECIGLEVDADYYQSGGQISILALGDEVESYKIDGLNQQIGGQFKITRAPWSVNPHDYQYDMSAYICVLNNGTPLTDYTNIAVGAFINDECVGVAQFTSSEYGVIRIRSNSSTQQEVIFKLYDYTAGQSLTLVSNETLYFESQGVLGSPSAPLLLSCPIIPVSSITLDNTQVALVEGESLTLVATVSPADATDKTITWSTSDAVVAAVENGVVTAVAAGTATITAQAGNQTATCVVTVAKATIDVEGITLNESSISLVEGETLTLVATITPDNATDKTVTWTTSDANVATVENGVVTAKTAGTATITAQAGDKTATCVVTVAELVIPVEGINLNLTSAALLEEEVITLVATVTPDDATDKTVTWSTSDAAVATVENGVVTAVAAGTATITATAGNQTATCVVTVAKATIDVEGVTLNESSISLVEGKNFTLVATVTPDNATDKTVTWTSSDEKVATVENGVVTAKSAGTATITAQAGDKTATCVVTVAKKVIAVSGITLSQTTAALIEGETVTLTATVSPTDATDKTVTWTSSDEKVATVENGVVTAKSAGTATITAQAGDKTATCVVTVAKKVIAVSGITLSQTTAALIEGETVTLTATVSPTDATDKTVTWSSSDEKVATVENGVVTAKSAGTATITAQAGDKTATCVVTVAKKVIAVSGITLSQTTAALIEGGTVTLTATVSPTDATDKTVTWSSSDEKVATVENGVVTAKSAGTATITAQAGDKTATCVVTVAKKVIAVSGITLSQTTAALIEGETVTLTATVSPTDATDKTVTWSSSDEKVATVENGVVTAKSAGTATITAQAGDKTATCVVTVAKKVIAVSGITLSQTTAALIEGETVTLTATVSPTDATDKTVTWSSSDEKVATVENGVVTAKSAGTATITAQAGDKTATCVVTVAKKVIAVSGITLSQTTAALIEGDTVTLTATVSPTDATDKTVTWTSSDEKVATVENGVVTAKLAGTATITAQAGDKTATCEIFVEKKVVAVEGISLDVTSVELTRGDSLTIVATVYPEDATDKTVVWSSSDEAVACVNSDGTIVALSAGSAIITATSNGYEASCVVVVNEVSGINFMLQDGLWPVDVYDMTGRMVKKNAYSISDLKKGVYLINGRKYFVNK